MCVLNGAMQFMNAQFMNLYYCIGSICIEQHLVWGVVNLESPLSEPQMELDSKIILPSHLP